MPQAVTHILIPILIVSIFRDFYLKKRDKKIFIDNRSDSDNYKICEAYGSILQENKCKL